MLNGYSGFTPASYTTHAEVMQRVSLVRTAFSSLRAPRRHAHRSSHKRRVPAELLAALQPPSPGLTLVADEGDQVLYSLDAGAR